MDQEPAYHKYYVLWLSLLAASILFLHRDAIPISIMEARNFVTSREMLSDNHWLLTTMNDVPRYQKPPLPSWIGSLFGFAFGESNLLAYRFPTSLMAMLVLVVWYFFSVRITGNTRLGFMSSSILVTSFYFYIIQTEAPSDLYAHGFMIISVYCLYLILESQGNVWQHVFTSSLFTGLSILSKGPVSLYAVLLPFLISYGVVYGFVKIRRRVWPLVSSLLIGALIGMTWYMYVRVADPLIFLAIAEKETGNWANYHVKPFYYYWNFFSHSGLWALPSFISLIHPYLKDKVSNKKAYSFALLWTISTVVLLSFIPEKKVQYIFPVMIPLALSTAVYLEYVFSNFSILKSNWEKFPMYIHLSLLLVASIGLPCVFWYWKFTGHGISEMWLIIFSVSSSICAIYIILAIRKGEIYKTFVTSLIYVSTITCFALPLLSLFYDPVQRKKMEQTDSIRNEVVFSYSSHAPELYWSYKQIVPRLDNDSTLALRIPNERSFKVLVPVDRFADFNRKLGSGFAVRELFTYDLNYPAQIGRKRRRTNWISKLYRVEKKSAR